VAPALQGEAARGLLDAARAAGARTFFDTSWDPGGFTAATISQVRELLRSVDVFLPSEAEARALAGTNADPVNGTRDAARALQADSGGWVVVKLGARGCLAVGPDEAELTAAAPVVVAADTTGAGDAFNAGLVHALSEGADWPQALGAATHFASAIIARPPGERHRGRQGDGTAAD
jgi:sugar/nucleoside kinase (ribokinase family)